MNVQPAWQPEIPSQQEKPVASHITAIARLDIPGGGQVTVANGLAFVGHMDAPYGTTIIDIKDPANPKILKQIMLDDNLSHTHKVRVAGNIMITMSSRPSGICSVVVNACPQ